MTKAFKSWLEYGTWTLFIHERFIAILFTDTQRGKRALRPEPSTSAHSFFSTGTASEEKPTHMLEENETEL